MKTNSLSGTEWLLERSNRVGGPLPKGSRGGGQAFGNAYMWISDDQGKSWKYAPLFSSYLDMETFIKANTDDFIKDVVK